MNIFNSYIKIGSSFSRSANPRRFQNPKILVFNQELSSELGLQINENDLSLIFSGQKKISEIDFYSLAYSGHQFGQFNPHLGDGRAIMMGECKSANGKWLDLQLKGAGPTEFSRRGDGLCALGPAMREYLVSESMNKLGISTTRSLAVVLTNELVMREVPLKGGIVTRVASSHLRVGSFQYFLYQKDYQGLKSLFDYTLNRLYPEVLKESELDRPIMFLKQVVDRQLDLISDWMSVGFIHGVMNTDNTSISGETIDYGPCAFMDQFNFHQVYSFIDRNGRYAYSEQPNILFWNMARLADSLIPLMDSDQETAVMKMNEVLSLMFNRFQDKFLKKMMGKLGAEKLSAEDQEKLLSLYFSYLHKEKIDFTLSNRYFAKEMIGNNPMLNLFPKNSDYEELKKIYQEKIASDSINFNELDKKNPIYIPRNHLIEEMIAKAYNGDFKFFEEYLSVLKDPFCEIEGEDLKKYATPPKSEEVVKNTFCGT